MAKIRRVNINWEMDTPEEYYEADCGKFVLYEDHIAAMNTCVKCGQSVTNWDDHIMTCEKSPAVQRVKELEAFLLHVRAGDRGYIL